ncbi:Hypothetical predicted protein [Pelobates cultripes]|uniref:Uncharacterized protein n=1 Tax=Pelobates cultripes TaxID=61616 RepID=A0AAD1RKG0_PELCU|nr:Hypothetical predicted protein [Pelobates cultripes]
MQRPGYVELQLQLQEALSQYEDPVLAELDCRVLIRTELRIEGLMEIWGFHREYLPTIEQCNWTMMSLPYSGPDEF